MLIYEAKRDQAPAYHCNATRLRPLWNHSLTPVIYSTPKTSASLERTDPLHGSIQAPTCLSEHIRTSQVNAFCSRGPAVFIRRLQLTQSKVAKREQVPRIRCARLIGMQPFRQKQGILTEVIVEVVVNEVTELIHNVRIRG